MTKIPPTTGAEMVFPAILFISRSFIAIKTAREERLNTTLHRNKTRILYGLYNHSSKFKWSKSQAESARRSGVEV